MAVMHVPAAPPPGRPDTPPIPPAIRDLLDLAGVSLYLLVDRFASPVTVSLFSMPGPDGYTAVSAVPVGEKLPIPAPFDVTLDTSGLPQPKQPPRPSRGRGQGLGGDGERSSRCLWRGSGGTVR